MVGLQVVLHFVGSRELLAAHRTGEYFALGSLVVQEGVSLETVFIFERLLDVFFGAFGALVDAMADYCVFKEIQPPHTHLRQLFRGIVVCAAGLATDPSAHLWTR